MGANSDLDRLGMKLYHEPTKELRIEI